MHACESCALTHPRSHPETHTHCCKGDLSVGLTRIFVEGTCVHLHLLVNKEKEQNSESHGLCQSVVVGEAFVCLTNKQKQYCMHYSKQKNNNGNPVCNREIEVQWRCFRQGGELVGVKLPLEGTHGF